MGFFVTFEGIEGCGKSTQISLLAEHLAESGHPFIVTREPGGTDIGRKIRSILLDTGNNHITSAAELMLYAADRAQHVERVIRPALSEEKTVLCDRFSDATMAYQGGGRGLDTGLIVQLNSIAAGGLKPDLSFLIDCPVETGIERAIIRSDGEGSREMRFEMESLSFHRKVREGYLAIAEAEPDRVQVIDGSRAVEEVYRDIIDIFIKKLKMKNR